MTTVLPAGEVKRLSDVADIVRGVTYKKADARSEPQAGFLPLLRATNIGAHLDLAGAMVYVSASNVSRQQLLRQGDIVLASSSGSLSVVGKSAPLLTDWDGTFGAFCAVVRPTGVDSHYLALYLSSETVRRRWSEAARGTNINNLKRSDLAPTPVPVPSMREQRRITEILEDHLSRLDAAREYESLALRRIASLREELIRRAVTGADEPGGRHVADLGDVGTLDGKLAALPSGWAWQRLGEIAEVVGGVTKDAKRQSLPDLVEVPYLRVANVQRAALRLDQVTTIRVPPDKARTLRLEPGDLLLNEGGDRDKLARGWVWQGEIDPCIHQNHVFRARLRVDVDPYFVSWTANTIGGRWAERNGKQSVNLASISLSMIRRMPVVVPPAGTSQAITERLQDQLAGTARLVSATEDAGRRREGLRRAVLAAAFEGKLTGRRTDDEVIEEMAGA